MILRPNLGARIFWGVAGVTLLITGCSMSALVFPVGLIVLCISLPLAVWSFGFAFGAAQTRFDEEGVFQRNFFFLTKRFAWNEIENARIESVAYDRTDSSGWTTRGTSTHIVFNTKEKRLYINSTDMGPEDWWENIRKITREKLGQRFTE